MNEPEEAIQTIFLNLMNAIQENHYLDFVRKGNMAFKVGINIFMFRIVAKQLSPRMIAGYDAESLGQLNQAPHQVYLWKLTFHDGGSDFLARLSVKNGKAIGMLIT